MKNTYEYEMRKSDSMSHIPVHISAYDHPYFPGRTKKRKRFFAFRNIFKRK